MASSTSAQFSLVLRVRIAHRPGMLGRVATAIGDAAGTIGSVDLVSLEGEYLLRDIIVDAGDEEHGRRIADAVDAVEGAEVVDHTDRTFLMHLGGKIEQRNKQALRTRDDLSMAYTPGVARVCSAIARDRDKAFQYTIKRNTVAVVSDGSAVLGLGDIGPEAIIQTVINIAPGFGGINLEDISAPRCFEIEARLKEVLDIPVFHDDQHGTAVVVLAALINAVKLVGKRMEDLKVVVNGVGAAGVACSKIVMSAGVRNLIGCDQHGAIYEGRQEHMNWVKDHFSRISNPNGERGSVHDVIKGADVFFGLSAPGVIDVEDVRRMAKDPVIFAMANPTPEIMPEEVEGVAAVMATGRSDYPNQINNVLCFPGIFRGALQCRASRINEEMKLAAAQAIASIITPEELLPKYIVPTVFDKRVAEAVAREVEEAAYRTGVARRERSRADVLM